MQKSYRPHKYQLEFHKSTARYRALIAGRRGGKTIAGAIEALYWADRMPEKLGMPTVGIVVAPTYIDLMDVNVRAIMEWCPPSSIKEWIKSEKRLTFINGSEIVFRYADPDTLGRGRKYHWAWLDEARDYPNGQMLWDTLRPSLTDYRGSVWVTTTPYGKDWVYKNFYEPTLTNRPNFQAWHYESKENPYLSTDEIEEARETMSEAMYRQEYLASFESFSGLIYPDFDRKTHITKEFNASPDTLFFVGIDVGWKHPTGIVLMAEDIKHKIIVIDEVQKQYLTAPDIESELDIMLSRNGLAREKISAYIIDPASKGTDQTSGMSIFDQLQDPSVMKIPIPLQPGVNDVMAGINRVTQYIRSGKFEILDKCIMSIGQMESYKWALSRNEEKKGEVYKVNDDLMDPMRYVIMSRPDWHERDELDRWGQPKLRPGEWMVEDGHDQDKEVIFEGDFDSPASDSSWGI